MRQKEVLLIIPAYNEEKNIEKVMKQLAQPEIADIVDVLVMNDASSDNTNWLAKEYGTACSSGKTENERSDRGNLETAESNEMRRTYI